MRVRNKGNLLVKGLIVLAAAAMLTAAVLTLAGRMTPRYIPVIFAGGALFFLGLALIRPERGERKISVRERVYFAAVALVCLAAAALTAVSLWEIL